MRFDGNLYKWDDARGFGFIKPRDGGQDIFVHISAFPRDGQRPRLDESLSFEFEAGVDGRKRAVGILRPRRARSVPVHRTPVTRSRSTRRGLGVILMLLVACALGAYGYAEHWRRSADRSSIGPQGILASPDASRLPDTSPAFKCDGRTHCSQMTSSGLRYRILL
jgi:cold shock CspA family protein